MAENKFPEWDRHRHRDTIHRNAEPQLGEAGSGAKLGLGVPSVGKLFSAES
jgi:hypothetical protein